MPYPPPYNPKADFSLDERSGLAVSGVKLARELSAIAYSYNRVLSTIRAIATSDDKLQPASLLQSDLSYSFEYTATSSQTEFVFTGGVTVDTTTASARVFTDGVRLADTDVTLATDRVTVPAQTAGTRVNVELFEDGDDVLTKLASRAADFGASLVGTENRLGLYAGANVEQCLDEVRQLLDSTRATLGDISALIRADGSVTFTNDQSLGGNKLTNLADGTAATDAVTLQQLQALSSIYSDLSDVFLALTGGTMSGPIAMADNAITGLPAPTGTGDAARKNYVDTEINSAITALVPRDGSRAMTGSLDMGSQRAINGADAVNDTDLTTLQQVTSLVDTAAAVVDPLFPDATNGIGILDTAGYLSIAHLNDVTCDTSFTAFVNRERSTAVWFIKGDFTLNPGVVLTIPARCQQRAVLSGLTETIATNVTGGLQANGGGHPLGGNGGVDDTGNGYSLSDTGGRDVWRNNNLLPIPGAAGSGNTNSGDDGGNGGGALTIIVDGQVTIDGTIRARGGTGGGSDGGYGGAGAVVIASLTGIAGVGAIDCGSNWQSGSGKGGGGGGGYIHLIAPDFTGDSISTEVRGGPDGASDGYAAKNTRTVAQIKSLMAAQGIQSYNLSQLGMYT